MLGHYKEVQDSESVWSIVSASACHPRIATHPELPTPLLTVRRKPVWLMPVMKRTDYEAKEDGLLTRAMVVGWARQHTTAVLKVLLDISLHRVGPYFV